MKVIQTHNGTGDNIAIGNKGMVIQSCGSMTISNGVVTVDGKVVEMPDQKNIDITIQGDVDKLSVDACDTVHVAGSCGSVKTMSGDVSAVGIEGNVKTMSGDVVCRKCDIQGNVSTMSGKIYGGR